MSLQEKVVVITGGSRGIGFAIANRLLREGAKVAICGTKEATVNPAVAQLSTNAAPDRVFGMVADVSKRAEVQSLMDAVLRRFKGIDVLVNNAGIGTFQSVADLEPNDWERTIGLNLSGVYYCCHEVLPILKQRKGGDIINIGSLAGRNPFAGGAAYNASKFGLIGFSEALMLDHRRDGVRVACIMPGSVATDFGRDAPSAGSDWKIAPDDIAEVVVTLLRLPSRTTISRVEMRPSRPPEKA